MCGSDEVTAASTAEAPSMVLGVEKIIITGLDDFLFFVASRIQL
jgi:hypothetical protein